MLFARNVNAMNPTGIGIQLSYLKYGSIIHYTNPASKLTSSSVAERSHIYLVPGRDVI